MSKTLFRQNPILRSLTTAAFCALIGLSHMPAQAGDVMQVVDKSGKPAFAVDPANVPASLLGSDLFFSPQIAADVDVPVIEGNRPGDVVPVFPEDLDQLTQDTVSSDPVSLDPLSEPGLEADSDLKPENITASQTEPVVESVNVETAPAQPKLEPEFESGPEPVLVKEVEASPPPQKLLPAPTPPRATPPPPPVARAPKAALNDGLFFDSEIPAIPQSQLGQKGAVRRVNPSVEPASKLDIVVRNRAVGSRQARLVSAERALKLGRHQSALEIYNELQRKNPRDLNVRMGRAIALQNLQRDEAAIQAYQDILSESPGHIKASINMYGLVAKRYPSVALRNLLQIHQKNPQNVGVLAQISVIEAHLGRYDNALKYIGIASSYDPNNANHIYNMAVISDRAGDNDKALQYYERALEVDAVHGGSRSVPRKAIFSRLAQLR